MKAPDQKLLAQHQSIVQELADAERARTEANIRVRKARTKLDNFVHDKGDIIAQQTAFERKQLWLKEQERKKAEFDALPEEEKEAFRKWHAELKRRINK